MQPAGRSVLNDTRTRACLVSSIIGQQDRRRLSLLLREDAGVSADEVPGKKGGRNTGFGVNDDCETEPRRERVSTCADERIHRRLWFCYFPALFQRCFLYIYILWRVIDGLSCRSARLEVFVGFGSSWSIWNINSCILRTQLFVTLLRFQVPTFWNISREIVELVPPWTNYFQLQLRHEYGS